MMRNRSRKIMARTNAKRIKFLKQAPGLVACLAAGNPFAPPLLMKFETYLLLAGLLFGVWKTRRNVQRSQSATERFFAIRVSVFMWFVGLLLLSAFLFLPNKQRVLLLLPAFVIAVTLAKFWRDSRARLRREAQGRVDLERMKRVK